MKPKTTILSILLLIVITLAVIAGGVLVRDSVVYEVNAAPANQPVNIDIDAAQDGLIYGDLEGLQRVQALEMELHNMQIRQDHPRLFITQETLPTYQARVRNGHPSWSGVLSAADSGDMVNAAFAYLMLKDDDPLRAQNYAAIAIGKLKETNPQPWNPWPGHGEARKTGLMALSFDWVYGAMSEADRTDLAVKIGSLANISGRAQWIRNGNKEQGETFHREEWIFWSWRAWPEIALAHHYADAEFCYKSRWNYDWFYGDAARMYAYVADGTPFEGYYYGADGVGWFTALKSATGMNLVDDPRWPWCKEAAYHFLYRLDFGMDREIFHHGVSGGAAGCSSYSMGPVAWRIRAYMGQSLPLAAEQDPHCQWVVSNISSPSSWLLSSEYYQFIPNIDEITRILYHDPHVSEANPTFATYQELPYVRLFPGGNEIYMRTGWRGDDTMAGFRTTPAYTKTSHGDFDVNTFVLYRKGVISPDSGVYDAAEGQSIYFGYQKNTVAHNNLLVVDPSRPDHPKKFIGKPDPGGTELVTTRTFGYDNGFGLNTAFVHNASADWGDIVAFETTPDYDYAVGKAAKAYGDRVSEYYRSVVFLRKGQKAYFIVFDRIESTNLNYDKRWLMHFVTEPIVSGNQISQEVPGHIDTYDGDLTIAENAFGTAAVYVKTLLPEQHRIRRIGGQGYEFYVEGTTPTNYPITQATIDRIEPQMGGPWIEVGQWRIELSPIQQQTRDYFLNVMYIGDPGETMAPVQLVQEGDWVGAIIDDPELTYSKILFTKTGTPDYQVSSTTIPPKPDIVLTKGADRTEAAAGEEITYTIAYTNQGAGSAQNITITDSIPDGTTYVADSATAGGVFNPVVGVAGSLTWSIATLPAGQNGNVSFRVRVE